MTEPDAIRCCLRALADAKAAHFLPLLYRLQQRPARSKPQLGLNLYQSTGGNDTAAYLVQFVSFVREDGVGVTWSVQLDTLPECVRITGSIEQDDDDGVPREIFRLSTAAVTADEAATAISSIAAEVCAQISYMEPAQPR